MRALPALLLAACLATPLMLAGCMSSQTTIKGQVFDRDTKAPIAGAELKASLEAEDASSEVRVLADGDGKYTIVLPMAGNWKVKASASGYEDAEQRGIPVEDKGTASQDFFLPKKAK